ncbi:hypothetical protein Dvar_26720 [Desulfosarcina variabilis str. Montpellier]|jgi:hypothetical protein|uniref:hypothetical protein n=1 Tax=Desulfosarcina variabilis TaxID=2300 RepID=UPI003AFA7125
MVNDKPAVTADNKANESRQAVITYAQSEKVKSGLIWVCQVSEQVAAMDDAARQHGMRLLRTLAQLVGDEALLAGRITGDRHWLEINQKINMALVMIQSGVPQETSFHLTQALTLVTRLGGQAAALLQEKGMY